MAWFFEPLARLMATSLLDSLRKTNVVADEHGGITQHIGAYKIRTEKGKDITFIDTPGHAAFTEMRSRGSKVTDIVVLVVAADDGVKPQTIEAINHSKAAKVPIIVAINKCDLPGADPQKIKNELLQYELIAEELSGDTLFVEVSATTKKNLEKLKENIILQSDLLDLKASYEGHAVGIILESRIDKGKGPVSTVLVTNGKLKKGDFFVSGNTWGKIRAMINDQGEQINLATPSIPVEILGMNNSALAGDDFIVVKSEDEAKEINKYRIEKSKSKQTPLISTKKESAFNEARDKLTQDNLALSNDERQNASLNLASDQRELEYLANSFQEDRNNRVQIETNKILVEMINAINKFGRDNGYDLIINEGRISQNTILNGGTLYKGASVDITNDIAIVLENNFQENKSGG